MNAQHSRCVVTATGPVDPESLGITDAHNHLWITPVAATPGLPWLADVEQIIAELQDYAAAGGGAIVDCQPGRAGRNAPMLRRYAETTGVRVVVATGFHLREYYPADEPLWTYGFDAAMRYFVSELLLGVEEAPSDRPIRAGFIKIACRATLQATREILLEAAAAAAQETGAAIAVHTEKGAAVEQLLTFFESRGVVPQRLIFCHVDKRADFGLHRELAQAGVLLEYDTFYRPKYDPDRNTWPLIEQMLDAGLEASLCLATDMAESTLWQRIGGGPGLVGMLTLIRPRLLGLGASQEDAACMLGRNIAQRLSM